MPAAGWFCQLIHNLSAFLWVSSLVAQDRFWLCLFPSLLREPLQNMGQCKCCLISSAAFVWVHTQVRVGCMLLPYPSFLSTPQFLWGETWVNGVEGGTLFWGWVQSLADSLALGPGVASGVSFMLYRYLSSGTWILGGDFSKVQMEVEHPRNNILNDTTGI